MAAILRPHAALDQEFSRRRRPKRGRDFERSVKELEECVYGSKWH